MPGTIIAKLSATTQADNTTITAANSGFTSGSAGSGNTAVHLAAAKMGEAEGYRFTQGGANQNNWFLDFASQTVLAFRIPYRVAATPTASVTFLRGFSDLGHATALWSMLHTTTNRIQFLETAGGGLNVTSPSGATALTPGSDYVIMGLYNATANTVTIRVYPRGSATAQIDIGGTLVGAAAVPSIRYGISTASALGTLDTNDAFAVGSGDFLARTDISTTPLSATLAVSPTSGSVPFTVTATATASGGTGGAKTYGFAWGDGSTTAATSSNTATHQYTTSSAAQSGGQYTVTTTVTEA